MFSKRVARGLRREGLNWSSEWALASSGGLAGSAFATPGRRSSLLPSRTPNVRIRLRFVAPGHKPGDRRNRPQTEACPLVSIPRRCVEARASSPSAFAQPLSREESGFLSADSDALSQQACEPPLLLGSPRDTSRDSAVIHADSCARWIVGVAGGREGEREGGSEGERRLKPEPGMDRPACAGLSA